MGLFRKVLIGIALYVAYSLCSFVYQIISQEYAVSQITWCNNGLLPNDALFQSVEYQRVFGDREDWEGRYSFGCWTFMPYDLIRPELLANATALGDELVKLAWAKSGEFARPVAMPTPHSEKSRSEDGLIDAEM